MNIWNIRFANLTLDYDQDRVANEVAKLTNLYNLSTPSDVIKEQWRIPLFTEEQINNTGVFDSDTDEWVEKDKPSWKGCSFTYLPDEPLSLKGASKVRNADIKRDWQWREDIEVPYIKSIVEGLKFVHLNTVRLLIIPPNSIGLIHNDDPAGSFYKNFGFSVTLNIKSGGSPIVFLEGEERHDVYPNKCFIFRDDCWHGIPEVKSERIQIRINGVPNRSIIQKLIDTENMILRTV